MKTVKLRISGRVQGVWFRAWIEQQALSHGLDGWVRNRRDGAVEAVFAGEDAVVDRMISACHEGPPAARVDDVTVVPDAGDPPSGFKTRPTE